MTWHPFLATEERDPGVWTLVDSYGDEYGRVEIRRTPDGIRYRCEFRGELIGWATTLRVGCERVNYAYIHSTSPAKGNDAYGQYA